ncbi:MAG: manganese catalase family protein [Clostridia bacterium]|nr:manganese catalase family protein [Clostridia bacterium]
MENRRKREYPSLDGVGEDHRSLRIISPAYAGREGEMTAILQYVYQSIVLGARCEEEVARALHQISVDEMMHLQLLGTLICKLGAPPTFTSCPPYPVGYYSASNVDYTRSPQKMILSDIAAERAAIAAYEKMLLQLTNERVRAVISAICEEEREHLCRLETLLLQV